MQRQKQGGIARLLFWLSAVVAFMIMLLGAPIVNDLTRGVVIDAARASYSGGMVDFIAWLWMLACWPLVFVSSAVALQIVLTILTLTFSARRW